NSGPLHRYQGKPTSAQAPANAGPVGDSGPASFSPLLLDRLLFGRCVPGVATDGREHDPSAAFDRTSSVIH
ncbi:hypothetical protein, partial [Rhodopirellula bahusiensis]|uniref:hypothetical protein n=1 Tax=Rhodopirellula bahusiensis TaxID=2014065 RepID=UPI0032647F5A